MALKQVFNSHYCPRVHKLGSVLVNTGQCRLWRNSELFPERWDVKLEEIISYSHTIKNIYFHQALFWSQSTTQIHVELILSSLSQCPPLQGNTRREKVSRKEILFLLVLLFCDTTWINGKSPYHSLQLQILHNSNEYVEIAVNIPPPSYQLITRYITRTFQKYSHLSLNKPICLLFY